MDGLGSSTSCWLSVFGAAFVFVAGAAGCAEVVGVECEVWSSGCGLDLVDCGGAAGAAAWVLDLALVAVAVEHLESQLPPL
ncbi:hypothetical protein A5699_02065 [Mycobacterium sp. E802]|nr:hypothetical protein A5699_02065 [Mycobacterium sp. E802]